MKHGLFLPLWTGVAVCVLTAAAGCGRSPEAPPATSAETIYDVKGVVREIEPAEKTIVIDHETIPGFMDAMVMPFNVKDTNLLVEVSVGDTVKFQLVVTETDSWISTMAKAGVSGDRPSPVPAPTEPGGTNEVPSLKGGDVVPDFELTDQEGRPFRLRDFRGKPVIVTFIFTTCPLPNFCPLMTRNFAAMQKELRKTLGDRFHLLSITIDPGQDTPEVLKEYALHFTQDLATWSFVTGSPEQIRQVATLFGLSYQPEGGTITHNLRTALIDPQGRIVHIWKSNVWQPEEVLTMVREITPPQ